MIYLNENPVEFITFPNKEKRLDLPKEFVKFHDTKVVNDIYWKYETDESIFELLLVDNAMISYEQEYNLYIGYMPYSRMDRVKEQGTAFSLEVIVRIINNLSCVNGIYVLDPHSPITLQELNRYQLSDNAFEFKYSLAKDVIDYTQLDVNNAWFVFPDKGAATRYNADDYPNVIICEKVRNFATGKIESIKASIEKVTNTPSENAPLIIIDDLCSYGGTFVGAIKAIETDLNIKSSENWLIVTHAETAIDMGQVPLIFNKIFTTDSIYTPQGYQYMNMKPFNSSDKVYVRPVLDIIKKEPAYDRVDFNWI